ARARATVARAIDAAVATPEAAVLRALLLGVQREIPDQLRAAYRTTGTAHVLSVSGLHIAVVAACAHRLARALLARWAWLAERLPATRGASLCAGAAVIGYAAVVGPAVATLRSLVMGGLVLGGTALVRRTSIESALAWAMLVVCGLDAGAWSDVSFQL